MSGDGSGLDEGLSDRLAQMGIVESRWQEVLARYRPQVLEGYLEYSTIVRDYEVLTPRIRELLVIAMDCVLYWPGPYLDQHFVNAHRLGCSALELVEVCTTAGHIGGPHAMNHGLSALARVLDDGRIVADDRTDHSHEEEEQ